MDAQRMLDLDRMVRRLQDAAGVFAQTTNCLAEIEAMKVANAERQANGHAAAYHEESFRALPAQYGITQDAVHHWLFQD